MYSVLFFLYDMLEKLTKLIFGNSLPNIVVFIAEVLLALSLIGVAIGLGLVIIEIIFKRIYKMIIGTDFIFTKNIATIVSALFAVILVCGFVVKLYEAIQTGMIVPMGSRWSHSPHRISWSDDRFGFIWAVVGMALAEAAFWGLISSLMLNVAKKQTGYK